MTLDELGPLGLLLFEQRSVGRQSLRERVAFIPYGFEVDPADVNRLQPCLCFVRVAPSQLKLRKRVISLLDRTLKLLAKILARSAGELIIQPGDLSPKMLKFLADILGRSTGKPLVRAAPLRESVLQHLPLCLYPFQIGN